MLIDSRLREIMEFFPRILPIFNDKDSSEIEKKYGVNLKEVVPAIMHEISKLSLKQNNREQAEAIFNWMQEAILYITGESDDFPKCELEPLDVTKQIKLPER